jgi:hypothetical protein
MPGSQPAARRSRLAWVFSVEESLVIVQVPAISLAGVRGKGGPSPSPSPAGRIRAGDARRARLVCARLHGSSGVSRDQQLIRKCRQWCQPDPLQRVAMSPIASPSS